MVSPVRPTTASLSGAFGLPRPYRRSFNHTSCLAELWWGAGFAGQEAGQDVRERLWVTGWGLMADVQECMNQQAEGLLHSLEGIDRSISQLELYCYKLERSIGELRRDVMDYHSERTTNFCCLEKNLRQVQKSVQILQDKHELAKTPKELTTLQIAHAFPARTNEATALLMLTARENDHNTQVAKHEVAFVPLHQVNGMQSSAMPVQSSSGYVPQQLVHVSLNTQHNQQHMSQAVVYYMPSQNHVKCTENKPSEYVVHVMQPHVQNHEVRVAV